MLGNALAAASLSAVDIERASKFYTEVVGLEQFGGGPDGGSAMFKAGDGSIVFIYQRGEATKAEHTALNFYINSGIQDIVKGLTDKGAVFEQYDFDELKTDANWASRHWAIQKAPGSKTQKVISSPSSRANCLPS